MLKHDIDTEYDSWLLEQAQLLRQRDFEHLDLDNLVEELEALVRAIAFRKNENIVCQIFLRMIIVKNGD